MRSGHLVMDYTGENIERLSAHYVEEIKRIGPAGQLVFAGVCQGGMIAHAVANCLRDAEEDVVLLAFIEQANLLPFAGNIAFFYTDESPFNPYTRFRNG